MEVTYDHEFSYSLDANGEYYPRLTFRVSSPELPTRTLDVEAHLDSGTQRSLFNGWIGRVIGVDLLRGRKLIYRSTGGAGLEARVHTVRIEHLQLGSFDLEVGFSTGPIARNLLGRDFFNLVQIGFRERELAFYITARP